ncbi:hypothetical protein CFP56_018366, partial [Quercus suber]
MGHSSPSYLKLFTIVFFWCLASAHRVHEFDKHPLSKINVYKTTVALSTRSPSKRTRSFLA